MKKISFYALKIFLLIVLLCSVSWAATETRDEFVAAKLDCLAQFSQKGKLGWADVCSVDEYKYSQLAQRNVAIDEAMEAASKSNVTPGTTRSSSSGSIVTTKPRELPKQIIILPAPPAKSDSKTISQTTGTKMSSGEGSAIKDKKHSFEIAPEYFYAQYDEPNIMNQEGGFYGISADYTYRPGQDDPFYLPRIFYGLQGEWAQGEMDYSSAGTGSLNNKKNMTWEVRGIFGGTLPDLSKSPSLRTDAYTGLGVRYLIDESENRQSDLGAWGYDRQQEYFYLPLGVNLWVQTNPVTALETNLEFDYMFWGHNTSKLGYLPGYSDLEFNQDNGIGFRVSLKMIREMKSCRLFAQPFWRYWKISESDTTSGSIEPFNTTKEVGLKVGVEF